jgi:opacity protein-like surface antigen
VLHENTTRRWCAAAAAILLSVSAARTAEAQGFISPSVGYNFGGSTGCRSATDCREKNWNWGGAFGALGSVVGFEAELTYEGEFTGDSPDQTSSVTTLMANFMLAPKISFLQPYGLVGVGVIRTNVEDRVRALSDTENDPGWTVGGGVIVFLQRHVGLKGDVRFYRSFNALDLLDFDLLPERSKIDFGRAGFGFLFKF